jgi:hypothetical protein
VDTRLKKIAEQHVADGTILAAAGLKRLGITGWPGVRFVPLTPEQMVPAVGQGAIAIQCREADAAGFAAPFDAATAARRQRWSARFKPLGRRVSHGVWCPRRRETLYFFHEQTGLRTAPLTVADFAAPAATAAAPPALWSAMSKSTPLAGRRMAVTRAREQASELSAKLTGLGAEVIELPLIRSRRKFPRKAWLT